MQLQREGQGPLRREGLGAQKRKELKPLRKLPSPTGRRQGQKALAEHAQLQSAGREPLQMSGQERLPSVERARLQRAPLQRVELVQPQMGVLVRLQRVEQAATAATRSCDTQHSAQSAVSSHAASEIGVPCLPVTRSDLPSSFSLPTVFLLPRSLSFSRSGPSPTATLQQ